MDANTPVTRKQPCSALWLTPIVRSDGKVSICLSDNEAHMDIGNIFDQDFIDVWLGSRANQYRMWHLKGKQENISICSICTYYEAHSVPGNYWDDYSAQMSREIERLDVLEQQIGELFTLPGKRMVLELKKTPGFRNFDHLKRTMNELLLQKPQAKPFLEILELRADESTSVKELVELIIFLFYSNTESQRLFSRLVLHINQDHLQTAFADIISYYILLRGTRIHINAKMQTANMDRDLLKYHFAKMGSKAQDALLSFDFSTSPENKSAWRSQFDLNDFQLREHMEGDRLVFSIGNGNPALEPLPAQTSELWLTPVIDMDGVYKFESDPQAEQIDIADSFFKSWFSEKCRAVRARSLSPEAPTRWGQRWLDML